MTEERALKYIASLLALTSARSIQAAKDLPNLKENTRDALRHHTDIAEALGISRDYSFALMVHTQ